MDKKILLLLARESIEEKLLHCPSKTLKELEKNPPPQLMGEEGAFVTLKEVPSGNLRGCIGNIFGEGPLYKTVYRLAKESAFHDPRFRPLTAKELSKIKIEVSILTPPKRVEGPQEINVGRDGVILTLGRRRALFLPQVAQEEGWDRETLLRHLSLKAGLAPDGWLAKGVTFETFQAEVIEEE